MSPRPRLFHMILPADWLAYRAEAPGDWRPASLGREGFVHLSLAHQLNGTLTAHFGAVDEVLLFEVELPLGDRALVFEASRGGADFPHLYRALRERELVRAWRLVRQAPAPGVKPSWSLPLLAEMQEADKPRGMRPA